jgi:1-acyl-sn-glycerol-3-phosphate acyltransferase
MKYLLFLPRAVFSIYGLLLFITILLLVFPLVIAASFFGKIRGGNFIYKVCQIWTDVFLPLCGIIHRNIYETKHDSSRQYVFIFNHISYLDIPVIIKTIRYQHFRILGKAEMVKIPIFGFLYRNAVVLVDRSSAEKRAKSVRQLKSVINKGISVVLAAEGTFNTTHHPLKEFFDGAFKVAIETQTPIKPILFLDTYDRLNYNNIFSLNVGRSRSVYLEEVSVEGLTLKDVPQLKEKVYKLMEEKLIRYKASWIKEVHVQHTEKVSY